MPRTASAYLRARQNLGDVYQTLYTETKFLFLTMRPVPRHVSVACATNWTLPYFLCPILKNLPGVRPTWRPVVTKSLPTQIRSFQLRTTNDLREEDGNTALKVSFGLPETCPGCGAYAQTVKNGDAGFYSINRKSVKTFIGQHRGVKGGKSEDAQMYQGVVRSADNTLPEGLGVEPGLLGVNGKLLESKMSPKSPPRSMLDTATKEVPDTPVCDRCHHLLHHHSGLPIVHPTLQSIQDIISESPHKYNHIYHVLDAADFPLSLIPQLQRHLSLMPQRSQNRRSRTEKFYHGQMAEMSFIITRSDLLAPKKEQVDALMPYLVEVLRDALGSSGKDVRLGNVRCVSSKRGWWTKDIKEAIWSRGGGGWLVGKVNVGKSNLFECVFPKGRNEDINFDALRHASSVLTGSATAEDLQSLPEDNGSQSQTHDAHSKQVSARGTQESSLLPPAPPEMPYPVMPIVSSLPGTTASPIRLPYGCGKGELVDLPGLSRGNLEDFVREECRLDLVMQSRVRPEEQFVVKPGQSLLINDLFRITPTTPNVILLACPFIPLKCHVTSTEKAIAVISGKRTSKIPRIAAPGVSEKLASAGIYDLRWDVTKQRAGPLTSAIAVNLKPQNLPFMVFSTDILVEGCGWVELAVQVRRRALGSFNDDHGGIDGKTSFPAVEVFSPEGKFIGSRRPMNAWVIGGQKPNPKSRSKVRPRRSMKGMKKAIKLANRANQPRSS
ncbi:hypothetical protein MMC06_005818 [Schaereria dolodes]|nr:hypothetical protein [Schaereria dolodes]